MAAFVALQDKLVDARAVACSPTMDLVAVLTADGQLLVHRTISWQKLLHVKPAEVVFEAVALVWSPDGLRLAVGCGEGEIVLFDVETGEQLPELRGLRRMTDALAHSSAITAMCWTDTSEKEAGPSQSAEHFQDRAKRFFQMDSVGLRKRESLLVTADSEGLVKLWWNAAVLLATVDIPMQGLRNENERLRQAGFHAEQVQLSPDLSRLLVWARHPFEDGHSSLDSQVKPVSGAHQLIVLDLTVLQLARRDICFLSQSFDGCCTILNDILLASKQLTAEWKNATRIFDLKMGLLGSLYEKYACEVPPQVDMVTIATTGVASPALAQYFAQDIQEMSIQRMQKSITGGCDALQELTEKRIKRGLVKLIFHLSEIRGQQRWSQTTFQNFMGIATNDLDMLLQNCQELLIELEDFLRALQSTRQDFLLLLDWISERIRVHTNSSNSSGAPNGSSVASSTAAYRNESNNSVLNRRRVSEFLYSAAKVAVEFKAQQQEHNKYKVETSFGNPISRRFLVPPPNEAVVSPLHRGSVGRLFALVNFIENAWIALAKNMTVSVANNLIKQESTAISTGENVQEFHMEFQECPESYRQGDRDALDPNSDSDDNEGSPDEDDDVDWDKLNSVQKQRLQRPQAILAGLRLNTSSVILLRHLPFQHRLSDWTTVTVKFVDNDGKYLRGIQVTGFGFYPSKQAGNQLAVLVASNQRGDDGSSSIHEQEARLALVPLKHLQFHAASNSHLSQMFAGCIGESQVHEVDLSKCRSRVLDFGGDAQFNSAAHLIPHGPRGVICVVSHYPHHRLAIFDAEEDNDEDDEASEGGGSEVSENGPHPSESMEIDL